MRSFSLKQVDLRSDSKLIIKQNTYMNIKVPILFLHMELLSIKDHILFTRQQLNVQAILSGNLTGRIYLQITWCYLNKLSSKYRKNLLYWKQKCGEESNVRYQNGLEDLIMME